jgi:hypothetical protein
VLQLLIEADSQGASKQSSLPSSPDFRPNKLGITKKMPGKTSVVPEYQGNSSYSSPKASRYFDHGAQLIINDAAKVVETL